MPKHDAYFSEIPREDWGAFYWSNATAGGDREARFVGGRKRRAPERVAASLREHDRLSQSTDAERRRLPRTVWDAIG
jgi:hypothetical protein